MTTKSLIVIALPLFMALTALPAHAQKSTRPAQAESGQTEKPKGPLGIFKKADEQDGNGTAAAQRSAKSGSDVKARHQEAKKEVMVARRERKAAQAREEAARARAEMIRAEKRAESAEKRSVNADKRADKARQKTGMR